MLVVWPLLEVREALGGGFPFQRLARKVATQIATISSSCIRFVVRSSVMRADRAGLHCFPWPSCEVGMGGIGGTTEPAQAPPIQKASNDLQPA